MAIGLMWMNVYVENMIIARLYVLCACIAYTMHANTYIHTYAQAHARMSARAHAHMCVFEIE